MIECNQLFVPSISLTAAYAVNENGEDDDVESLLVEKLKHRSEIQPTQERES